jgi:prepilin-type N-terminal cleavage/methylation domain-containing protein
MAMISPVTRHSFAFGLSRQASVHVTGREAAAFTLIELLVVMAIIAILAGLGFGAVQGALNSGKKAQARNDVNQLAAAIKAFQLEYGRLPSTTAGSDAANADNASVISALTSSNALNPRGIVFFEAKTAKGTPPKGGLSGGKYLDPWGGEYTFSLDTSYDNRIGTTMTTAIVESPGDPNQSPRQTISNVK